MTRSVRASAAAAARKISVQSGGSGKDESAGNSRRNAKRKNTNDKAKHKYNNSNDDGGETPYIPNEVSVQPKRRKVSTLATTAAREDLYRRLFSTVNPKRPASFDACRPPQRRHATAYHRPLLLDSTRGREVRHDLLSWYDSTSGTRGMPWRKPWANPASTDRAVLAVRAYEVWISEIMAQQTRIPVVIDYWTHWIARWPTVASLAAAAPDDVLAAWRGLGYYSRAARLHAAAQAIMAAPDLQGLLPADATALQSRVPGIGRYTAGAISAIVFGRAAAMVDGNVMRVLSRQMGLYADPTTDRGVGDMLWAAAEALVRVVAWEDEQPPPDLSGNPPTSDRPGRWGQALMELGSTVCTPKPGCAACPIRSTCRAYAEGLLGKVEDEEDDPKNGCVSDIEDACQLCEPFEMAPRQVTKKTSSKTSAFFESGVDNHNHLETAISHARLFPLRRPKKAARVLETLVCAVRTMDGHYLLQRRPARGLLAGLWQLPSHDLPEKKTIGQASQRQKEATAVVQAWWGVSTGTGKTNKKNPYLEATCLGTVPWLFSHIRQTMHVFLFEVDANVHLPAPSACCWVTAEAVNVGDAFTMGTGMRRCWDLVQEHINGG